MTKPDELRSPAQPTESGGTILESVFDQHDKAFNLSASPVDINPEPELAPILHNLEGDYREVVPRGGHTIFSFRTNGHVHSGNERQFGELIIRKGRQLSDLGLLQPFDQSFLVPNLGSASGASDDTLCICTYEPPNWCNFVTVRWAVSTGPGGGGSITRFMNGTSAMRGDAVFIHLFNSLGRRYVTIRIDDTNIDPRYGIRHIWQRL